MNSSLFLPSQANRIWLVNDIMEIFQLLGIRVIVFVMTNLSLNITRERKYSNLQFCWIWNLGQGGIFCYFIICWLNLIFCLMFPQCLQALRDILDSGTCNPRLSMLAKKNNDLCTCPVSEFDSLTLWNIRTFSPK